MLSQSVCLSVSVLCFVCFVSIILSMSYSCYHALEAAKYDFPPGSRLTGTIFRRLYVHRSRSRQVRFSARLQTHRYDFPPSSMSRPGTLSMSHVHAPTCISCQTGHNLALSGPAPQVQQLVVDSSQQFHYAFTHIFPAIRTSTRGYSSGRSRVYTHMQLYAPAHHPPITLFPLHVICCHSAQKTVTLRAGSSSHSQLGHLGQTLQGSIGHSVGTTSISGRLFSRIQSTTGICQNVSNFHGRMATGGQSSVFSICTTA